MTECNGLDAGGTGLPPGWELVRLSSFAGERAVTVNPAGKPDAEFTLYSVPAHAVGKPETLPGRSIGSSKVSVTPGTVLLCKINPRINRVWVVADHNGPEPNLIASTEWITFPPNGAVVPEYLRFFLMREPVRAFLAASASGVGGSLMRSNAGVAGTISLPLAPFGEQHRIVAVIEALFTDLDEAGAALSRARAGLSTYRASLLHAACTGQLTAAWRASRPPSAEDGPALLRRILAKRRAAWERAEHARMQARGKMPTGDGWKARYQEPAAPDATGLPELSEGWTWASLEQLSWASSYGTSAKCQAVGGGIPVLRIPNIQSGTVSWSNLKYAQAETRLEAADHLAPGDFLIVRTNGSPGLLGRAAVIDQPPKQSSYFASYLIRFRLLGDAVLHRWIAALFAAPLVRDQVGRYAATSAGQYNISQTNLARFALPLPPADEMGELVSNLADSALDDGTWTGQETAVTLRQSILHAAFTGRLVPQVPADEPAAALLARLRAEPHPALRARRVLASLPSLFESRPM